MPARYVMQFGAIMEATTSGKRETPATWVKRKTGYALYTGNDKVLSRYAFRGSPSIKNMGIADWPDEETNNLNDASKKRYLANKFEFSRPRVMLVNHTAKQIALLPSTAENGQYDRGHHHGLEWAERHSGGDGWEFVDGHYVYDSVNPKTVEMALALGFLNSDDELVEMVRGKNKELTGYRKTSVGKYLASKQGKAFKPQLTAKAKQLIELLDSLYRLELKLSQSTESPMSEKHIRSTMASKFEDLGQVVFGLDPRMGYGDRPSADVSKAFDMLIKAWKLSGEGEIDQAMVSLSIGKQFLHRFTKEEPDVAEELFGSKEIVAELSRISAIGDKK